LSSNTVISLNNIKVACQNCSLASLCLPMGLSADDVERLEAIIKRSRPLRRGDHLFESEGSFRSLFAVKTGSIKTYTLGPDGTEQVLGFHLPGDLVGLDAIQDEQHKCSARVLETSTVCELPFNRLEELASHIPSLQHQLFRLLSREISHESDMQALLGRSPADERLASFLIGLSERYRRRGFSPREFILSMSRQEIGSYLGLALETVSRLFTRFQDDGILRVERKHIEILDMDRLKAIVAHHTQCEREAQGGN
jgi:CRP/FNR family transcriptional regulator